ncbi:hypothetical protein [Puniceibacterium sp. IMCC21224]|uniref:hypothetical protein n=1 Tax=Puniceibacterium sp. IMCC21224 TaxID=1618204 RepID=UPI00064DD195|nr:hypothetical protein [Puniceibacterium sp. IMCC21224]
MLDALIDLADTRDESTKIRPYFSALGAVLLSLPLSLVLTAVILVRFDLHILWSLPLYSLLGSVLTLVFVLIGRQGPSRS